MELFRELDEKETKEFRQWARDNYRAGQPANECWHPIVRDEWFKLDKKAGIAV